MIQTLIAYYIEELQSDFQGLQLGSLYRRNLRPEICDAADDSVLKQK